MDSSEIKQSREERSSMWEASLNRCTQAVFYTRTFTKRQIHLPTPPECPRKCWSFVLSGDLKKHLYRCNYLAEKKVSVPEARTWLVSFSKKKKKNYTITLWLKAQKLHEKTAPVTLATIRVDNTWTAHSRNKQKGVFCLQWWGDLTVPKQLQTNSSSSHLGLINNSSPPETKSWKHK